MASSSIALTVMFGFTAALCCLQLLGADTTTTTTTQSGLARLAAASLVPALLAALTLTPLLAFARVHARAEAGALVAGLAKATLLAGTVALVAAAVVQLGADGHLDRGRDDVARLNVK